MTSKIQARNFVACGNAMQKQHLELFDFVGGAEVVPAGIVEVVRRQEQGWEYASRPAVRPAL